MLAKSSSMIHLKNCNPIGQKIVLLMCCTATASLYSVYTGILVPHISVVLNCLTQTTKVRRIKFLKIRGLRGQVVKVADLRSQVPHRYRLDPHSGRNLSCEEAIQLAYGRSVILPRCPHVSEIMPGGTPRVFLHQ
jgi:hypothetical protein